MSTHNGQPSGEELRELLWNQKAIFSGTDGTALCDVEFDMRDGMLRTLRPAPYENLSQQAEQNGEYVYVTDEKGNVTDERLTRKEARERNARYLVVTALIFHNGKLLTQRRSKEKALDPGLESASAHGVAKELQLSNGQRVTRADFVGLTNLALEITEELRHGKNETPFTVRLWPGSQQELFDYASSQSIDDPDTVYLVHPVLYTHAAYPLMAEKSSRTRLVARAFIFSSKQPHISVDSSEADGTDWVNPADVIDLPGTTEDIRQCLRECIAVMLMENSVPLARRALRRMLEGNEEEV